MLYDLFWTLRRQLHSLPCLLPIHTMNDQCRYVRPQFVDESAPPQLRIVQGRHPVLDVALDTPVVPNDTDLRGGGPCALVITGPNMGGKSCYIRQAALIAIMAQVCLHLSHTPSQIDCCRLVQHAHDGFCTPPAQQHSAFQQPDARKTYTVFSPG